MNLTMMLLADCIKQPESIRNDLELLTFIRQFGKIVEIKAVAYRDL